MNSLIILFEPTNCEPQFILAMKGSAPECLEKLFGETLLGKVEPVHQWIMDIWKNNLKVLGHPLYEDIKDSDLQRLQLEWEKKLGMKVWIQKKGKPSQKFEELSAALKKIYSS
jgi:hypothetical protein